MKFKSYLINEGISKRIDDDEAMELLKKNCKQALERYFKNHFIYRATNAVGEFLLVNPTSGRRSAFAVGNYYTLILNNHPMGRNYPKRSLICSGGSGQRASTHGADNLYLVFPYDGAKIGICPSDDIGDSFDELKKYDIDDGNYFNRTMDFLGISDDNGKNMKEDLENTTIEDLANELEYPGNMPGDNVYEFITKTFDPKKNGFEVVPISKYDVGPSEDLEVWTDSKSILVNVQSELDLRGLKDEI